MARLWFFFVLILLTFNDVVPAALSGEAGKGSTSQITVQFRAKGMVCAMCVQSIRKRFLLEQGVRAVDIDLPSRVVRLQVEDVNRFSDAFLKQVIEDAGFAFDTTGRVPAGQP